MFTKFHTIIIEDELAGFYGEIGKACGKPTETILEDTLFKVMDMIIRSTKKENI